MRTWIYIVPALLVGMSISMLATRPVSAQDADPLAEINKRLTAIEKAVIKDNVQPSNTHAARLERIEKLLQLNAKDEEKEQKTDAKTFEELRASLVKTQREVDTLDRRVILMEKNKTDRKTDDLAGDLKDLQRTLSGHTSTLRDLESRVKKLESAVRP
jgi:uncharacterized membrane-anchored protein YhcB (DUF1043 family)